MTLNNILESFQYKSSEKMYRELQLRFHPDKKGGDIKKSKEINAIKDSEYADEDIRVMYKRYFGREIEGKEEIPRKSKNKVIEESKYYIERELRFLLNGGFSFYKNTFDDYIERIIRTMPLQTEPTDKVSVQVRKKELYSILDGLPVRTTHAFREKIVKDIFSKKIITISKNI